MISRTAGRTFDLYEAFAQLKRPATLSEIAEKMAIPVSTCFGLIKTATERGYMQSVKPKGIYPTKRMLAMSQTIALYDPVSQFVGDALVKLRDESGETVVLGKRAGEKVVYLDVIPSIHSIRYTAEVGETRTLHANSIGKAILAALPAKERDEILAHIKYPTLTAHTAHNAQALQENLVVGMARGWQQNVGESTSDLCAVACGFEYDGEVLGVSIVGPHGRITPRLDELGRLVANLCEQLHRKAGPTGTAAAVPSKKMTPQSKALR